MLFIFWVGEFETYILYVMRGPVSSGLHCGVSVDADADVSWITGPTGCGGERRGGASRWEEVIRECVWVPDDDGLLGVFGVFLLDVRYLDNWSMMRHLHRVRRTSFKLGDGTNSDALVWRIDGLAGGGGAGLWVWACKSGVNYTKLGCGCFLGGPTCSWPRRPRKQGRVSWRGLYTC